VAPAKRNTAWLLVGSAGAVAGSFSPNLNPEEVRSHFTTIKTQIKDISAQRTPARK
jgi:hypothetical protein